MGGSGGVGRAYLCHEVANDHCGGAGDTCAAVHEYTTCHVGYRWSGVGSYLVEGKGRGSRDRGRAMLEQCGKTWGGEGVDFTPPLRSFANSC